MSRTEDGQAPGAPAAPSSSPLGVCLAGPTGSGKTALAMAFARALALQHGRPMVEIVSVDSALVYRGMDIGTAKPSPAERAEVPHHLIDLLEPSQAYSAAAFAADAQRLAAEIRARGRLPLLVGGTMLYFKALREGLDVLPAADPVVRAAIEAEAAARGWPALHAELARVDPVTAKRLAPMDAQRIQRALEVWRVSGRPLAEWHGTRGAGGDDGDRDADRGRDGRHDRPRDGHRDGPRDGDGRHHGAAGPARWPLVSLEPRSRAWLHERLGQRFMQMLAQGLVDEVRALRARGDLRAGLPSMRSVGYRQAWEALDRSGLGERNGPDGLAGLAAAGIAATRQLAKRQLTWLRSLPARQVVAADEPDAIALGIAALQRAAAGSPLAPTAVVPMP